MRLGLITIGQTPRRDILDDIEDLLVGIEYVEYGVLDGLEKKYIVRELSPKPGEEFYVTRLSDGSEVRISRRIAVEMVKSLIHRVEDEVDVIVVMCTGDFEGIESRKPVILPSLILINVVKSLEPSILGVVIPSKEQIDMAYTRWSGVARDVVVKAWSPYTGSIDELKSISRELSSCDLVVMDCIGYSRYHGRIVKEYSGKLVVLPRTLVIALARSILLRSLG